MGKILDKISSPDDLKSMPDGEVDLLCEEIRELIISSVSQNGGHLASNLGVVELTVALASVFDLPEDKIIWDVGHQSYPYKILTERYKSFDTVRCPGGISGFPNRDESRYDTITSGHSSTSVSVALGISEANFLQNKDQHVVAVIGDGALTGGLAYEGLNNAGRLHRNLIVILNDNNMSISKSVGSIARYLTHLRVKPGYIKSKMDVEQHLKKLPVVGNFISRLLKKIKRIVKKTLYSKTLFEDFGFTYYGPFDGHDVNGLKETLEAAKIINKPVLIHVRTNKGKGYRYAEMSPTMYHGLAGFDVKTGQTGASSQDFSTAFGKTLCDMASENDKICAITAAMQNGTGLCDFRSKYSNRFFDVGIAEEHAVTFSGALSLSGMLPVFAVYSTFLQRGYDELIHDVALQNTKVILAIDRAGIVGEDGKTHQGVFDAAFLQTIPNVTLYSPSFFDELSLQFRHLAENGNGICAIRYPRGIELFKPESYKATIKPYSIYNEGQDIAIVTYGRIFSFAAKAAERIKENGISTTLVKLNRIIPIEEEVCMELKGCKHVFFFEEGIRVGGIGEHFGFLLYQSGFTGKFTLTAIENAFIEHNTMFESLKSVGLTDDKMKEKILSVLKEGG